MTTQGLDRRQAQNAQHYYSSECNDAKSAHRMTDIAAYIRVTYQVPPACASIPMKYEAFLVTSE